MEDDEGMDSEDADDMLADDDEDEESEDEEVSLEKLMAEQKRKAATEVPAGSKNLQPAQKRPNNGGAPQQPQKPQQQAAKPQ